MLAGRLQNTFVALCLAYAVPSWCQISTSDQIDFNTARSDALLGTSFTPTTPPTIGSVVSYGIAGGVRSSDLTLTTPPLGSINLLNPINYVRQFPGGSAPAESAEFTPQVKAGLVYRLRDTWSFVQVSASLGESSDRYTGSPANTDALNATLRFDFVGTDTHLNRDAWVPYFSYMPSEIYAAFYATRKQVNQDYTIGIQSYGTSSRTDGRWKAAQALRAPGRSGCNSQHNEESRILRQIQLQSSLAHQPSGPRRMPMTSPTFRSRS